VFRDAAEPGEVRGERTVRIRPQAGLHERRSVHSFHAGVNSTK